jgi:transglutaminase-like putative cysteine protease
MLLPSQPRHRLFPIALVLSLVCLPTAFAENPTPTSQSGGARSRTFLFTYNATITGLPADKTARVWLPVPPTNEDQRVQIVSKDLPAEGRIGREPKFGNQILYVEAKAGSGGKIPLTVTYRVTRHEVKGDPKTPPKHDDPVELFLQPNALVPITGKPLELLKDKELPREQLAAARVLYDLVNNHMRYSKEGTGWGQGDSVWACESGYGNCTDFHSLFMSLARANKIPVKFEIGFHLPPKRGGGEIPGYHCWAKFQPDGGGWVPVDISEANKNPKMKDYYFGNLTENRVTFSTGRDLDLVPKQVGKPLNFFVYPYVEVDGKPYADNKIQRKFSFKDIEPEGK